jgi:hypothetical protein
MVRLCCDGVGLVAVAWTRVCMRVCCVVVVVCVCLFVFVCVVVWLVCSDAVWTLLTDWRRRCVACVVCACVGLRRLTGGLVAGGRRGCVDTGCTVCKLCVCV